MGPERIKRVFFGMGLEKIIKKTPDEWHNACSMLNLYICFGTILGMVGNEWH